MLNFGRKFRKYYQKISNFRNYSFLVSNEKCNENDKEKVLSVVNNSTENELISLGIPKSRSQRIVDWRNSNGDFQDINEMMNINGFGIKVVGKVVDQILNPVFKSKDNIKTNTGAAGKYSIPSVPESKRMLIKTCVSLHIGISHISWTRFELNTKGPCILTHWNFCNVLDKKLHINDLVKQCSVIIDEIPNSDCYVLENPKIAQMAQPGSPPQVNINIQKSQIIAIISYGLTKRNQEENNTIFLKSAPNLFYLKRYLHSRLFGILVGSESVSTSDVILGLMRTHYNMDNHNPDASSLIDDNLSSENIRGKVSIPFDFRKEFQNFDGVQREFLGQSMLIGLTFIRLCILRCKNSIVKLVNNSKENDPI